MIPSVREKIDRKAANLARVTAHRDPAIASWAGQIAKTVRGIQSFEGNLIAEVLPSVLAESPHLNIVAQPRVVLPQRAVEAVEQGIADLAMEYTGHGPSRKLDFVCVDARTGMIEFVECKRGLYPIGADHQRSRLRDDAVLELIGRSYAWQQFRQVVVGCRSVTVSYYGRTGLPEDRTIRAGELDHHYGCPVQASIAEHLQYFRQRLNQEIPGLTEAAA